MEPIKTLIATLKPFRELILIVVALASAAYGAITYFATADQLAKAKLDLERLQTSQHTAALGALEELKCINRVNRELLRSELEEFQLTTLLQNNIIDSEKLRGDETPSALVTKATLSASRDTISRRLHEVDRKKQTALKSLRDAECAETA